MIQSQNKTALNDFSRSEHFAAVRRHDGHAVLDSSFVPHAYGSNHHTHTSTTLIKNADNVMKIHLGFSGKPSSMPLAQDVNFALHAHKLYEKETTYTYENRPEKFLPHLFFAPICVDELSRACHLTISTYQKTLLEMEPAGCENACERIQI